MKILILEDESEKADAISAEIRKVAANIEIATVSNFRDYTIAITKTTYDLIVVDLLVLRFPDDEEPKDMTAEIIDVTRSHECPNFRTPVSALTRFQRKAEENFKDLNSKDITVITFQKDAPEWRECIRDKVVACTPAVRFDFVIICALTKEADAFAAAGYVVDERQLIGNLACRRIQIGSRAGVIVTAPRPGLVSAAVTTTQAIELFEPQFVCMSGICGGVPGQAKIYDVIIPDVCHQHDSGKWTPSGFQSDIYSVQLDHGLRTRVDSFISQPGFSDRIGNGVTLGKSEFPPDQEALKFSVFLAPTSSGSAVVADDKMVSAIRGQQRKQSAFEMESFAVYESARLSMTRPRYFSAKAVVDDGSPSKGDAYHRVASILSAKVVYECINAGVFDAT